MLSRSPDVRATVLGQSLSERDVRMTKRLWRELARVLDARPSGGRVDLALDGTNGDGYTTVWALTEYELLALCEKEGVSRVVGSARSPASPRWAMSCASSQPGSSPSR